MTLTRYLLFLGPAKTGALLEPFLHSPTTKKLFLNSPNILREEFVELFSGQTIAETMAHNVRGILQSQYINPPEILQSFIAQMYSVIKQDQAMALQELCES